MSFTIHSDADSGPIGGPHFLFYFIYIIWEFYVNGTYFISAYLSCQISPLVCLNGRD